MHLKRYKNLFAVAALAMASTLVGSAKGYNGGSMAPDFNEMSKIRHVAPTDDRSVNPSTSDDKNIIIYHVRKGELDICGHAYPAGSGNKKGFNNPDYEKVQGTGPVPQGTFNVIPRIVESTKSGKDKDGLYYGFQVWRVDGTPGRNGILLHPDCLGVSGCPIGESEGCIAIKTKLYDEFRADMRKLNVTLTHPARIIVKPN